jgi:hypothetical protein
MTKDERTILQTTCRSVLALLEMQVATNRKLQTLLGIIKTQIPNLEEVYQAVQRDAQFATRESLPLEKLRQQLEAVIESLNREHS